MTTTPEPDGVALIAAERERQLTVKGYDNERDDTYTAGELRAGAATYVWAAGLTYSNPLPLGPSASWPYWPWWERPVGASGRSISEPVDWNPESPIRNLVKAGAMIAAEIDRLQRAGETP